MAQVTAGEEITIELGTGTVLAKIEDASKSDAILAKIVESSSDAHRVGNVYTFERALLGK